MVKQSVVQKMCKSIQFGVGSSSGKKRKKEKNVTVCMNYEVTLFLILFYINDFARLILKNAAKM